MLQRGRTHCYHSDPSCIPCSDSSEWTLMQHQLARFPSLVEAARRSECSRLLFRRDSCIPSWQKTDGPCAEKHDCLLCHSA